MKESNIDIIRNRLKDALELIDKLDPYAELKAAHAAGKVIQCICMDGEWVDCTINHPPLWNIPASGYRIKPEPWTLGRELPGFRALRDGEEWHRQDFTKEMLPDGWRPLLKGEDFQAGEGNDEYRTRGVEFHWQDYPSHEPHLDFCRTKRPLPLLTKEQIDAGWIEWNGGENPVPGKRVNYMTKDGVFDWRDDSDSLRWSYDGVNTDIIAYRVIEPKTVELESTDILPFTVFRTKTGSKKGWHQLHQCPQYDGVDFSSGPFVRYKELHDDWIRNQSIPLTGKWNPDAWEPCSKQVEVNP